MISLLLNSIISCISKSCLISWIKNLFAKEEAVKAEVKVIAEEVAPVAKEVVEKVVESTQYELMLPKMMESLDSDAFELWNNLFTLLKCDGTTISEKDTIRIHYSGGGDSGDIDSINIEELEKDAVSLDEIFDSLSNSVLYI